MLNHELERRQIAIAIAVKLTTRRTKPSEVAEMAMQYAAEIQEHLRQTNTCPHKGRVAQTSSGMRCFDCGDQV